MSHISIIGGAGGSGPGAGGAGTGDQPGGAGAPGDASSRLTFNDLTANTAATSYLYSQSAGYGYNYGGVGPVGTAAASVTVTGADHFGYVSATASPEQFQFPVDIPGHVTAKSLGTGAAVTSLATAVGRYNPRYPPKAT